MNQKFLLPIIALPLVVAGYFYLYNRGEKPLMPPLINPVASSTVEVTPTASSTVGLIPIKTERSAWFEGWDKVEFGVSVPERTSNITGGVGWLSWLAPDNKSKVVLDASYEGGRGYQPNDYFEEEIKKTCSKCVEVGPVFMPNVIGKIYSDGVSEFSAFSMANNGAWLFHAQYPASASGAVKSQLVTFWAKSGQEMGEIAESPLTIYLVKSSGVTEEYVPVKRYIMKTTAVATAAINELLIGPSLDEEKNGLVSALPLGSKLNSLKIENGVAYADFDQQTQSGGGSTSMFLRRGQIEKTLKQFPTVSSVVISINGESRQDLIFQP